MLIIIEFMSKIERSEQLPNSGINFETIGKKAPPSPFMAEVKRLAMEVIRCKPSVRNLMLNTSPEAEKSPTVVESLQAGLDDLRLQFKKGTRESNKALLASVKETNPALYRAYLGINERESIDRKADARAAALGIMADIGRQAESNLFKQYKVDLDGISPGQSVDEGQDNKDAA